MAMATPNSKIYYPLYGEGSISSTITSPSIVEQVGSYTAPGTPAAYNSQSSATTPNGGAGGGVPTMDTSSITAPASTLPVNLNTATGFASLPESTRSQIIKEYCKYYNITGSGETVVAGGKIIVGGNIPQPPLSVDEWGTQWAVQQGYLDKQGKSTLAPDSLQQQYAQQDNARAYFDSLPDASQTAVVKEYTNWRMKQNALRATMEYDSAIKNLFKDNFSDWLTDVWYPGNQ